MMSRLRHLVPALLALGLLVGFAACKQGVNEVCQVNADCEPGLTCNAATQVCQPEGSNPGAADARPAVDAGPTPDAPSAPDAAAPDADISAIDADTPDA
jgi:hypothetical protein